MLASCPGLGESTRVAYSGDGRLIAWVTTEDTVRVSETRTIRELASLYNGGTIFLMAFSPDGTRMAVGCKDNTIRLWDLTSYQQVAELRGHTDYVHAVAFSPDGTQLVSGSGDSTSHLGHAAEEGTGPLGQDASQYRRSSGGSEKSMRKISSTRAEMGSRA